MESYDRYRAREVAMQAVKVAKRIADWWWGEGLRDDFGPQSNSSARDGPIFFYYSPAFDSGSS